MSSDKGLLALAFAIIAVILVGEAVAYVDVYSYDSEVLDDGTFTVSTSGSHVFDVVSSDNGSYESVRTLLIFRDDGYGGVSHDVTVEVGARALDEGYYVSQLINNLSYLGFSDVETVDASSLKSALSSDGSGKGVVVLHGALPDTVYDGSDSCPLLAWISSGGTLYWAGEALGKYIGHSDGTVSQAPEGYQELFLGARCIYDSEVSGVPADNRNLGRAYGKIASNGYCDALCLKNNNVLFGVDPSMVPGTSLSVGYSQDGFSSITFVKNGDGCVCVMGGLFSNYQRMDLATVVSAGIGPESSIADASHGTASHGSVEGKVSIEGDNASVLVFLGGEFSVYGKTFYPRGS